MALTLKEILPPAEVGQVCDVEFTGSKSVLRVRVERVEGVGTYRVKNGKILWESLDWAVHFVVLEERVRSHLWQPDHKPIVGARQARDGDFWRQHATLVELPLEAS